MFLSGKVTFPPVRIKLHWPDRWCSYCLQETVTLEAELYYCPSCDKYTTGRTEYVEATVRPL